MVTLAGWSFTGFLIAVVAKRMRVRDRPEPDRMVTVLSILASLVAGDIGGRFRLYYFGEPAGFVAASVSAALLLSIYDATRPTPQPPSAHVSLAPPLAPAAPAPSLAGRIVDAVTWASLFGLAIGITGIAADLYGWLTYSPRLALAGSPQSSSPGRWDSPGDSGWEPASGSCATVGASAGS